MMPCLVDNVNSFFKRERDDLGGCQGGRDNITLQECDIEWEVGIDRVTICSVWYIHDRMERAN